MKKVLSKTLLCASILVLLVFVIGAASLTTRVSSYRTLHTVTDVNVTPDTDLIATTGYTIGVPSGSTDLLVKAGSGKNMYANSISIILSATDSADGDTITEKLYGVIDGGPPQLIASIVWTIGTARLVVGTATNLWADTAVVTSTHITTIKVADGGGSNRVCSVTLDFTGYRYVKGLFTAEIGAQSWNYN